MPCGKKLKPYTLITRNDAGKVVRQRVVKAISKRAAISTEMRRLQKDKILEVTPITKVAKRAYKDSILKKSVKKWKKNYR